MHLNCYDYANHNIMRFYKKDLNNNKNAHIIDWDELRDMRGGCWNDQETVQRFSKKCFISCKKMSSKFSVSM